MTDPHDAPRIRGVLETSLYCEDLNAAERFYTDILGLEKMGAGHNRHLFYRCGDGILLIFNPEATREGAPESADLPVGAHGAYGEGHVAFRATEEEIEQWKQHLEAHGVEVELELDWEQGGRSIYFRDPGGNSLEFATPSVWGIE